MRSHAHHSRFFLSKILPEFRRDYMGRRRVVRRISNIVLIIILSLLVAGVIIYTSNPGGFVFASH